MFGIYIFQMKEHMFVVENFIKSLVSKYDKNKFKLMWCWYPQQAYQFLHLKHRLYLPLEKKYLIEGVMQ